MKKHLIILFFSIYSFSQKSGEIFYHIKIENDTTIKNNSIKKILNSAVKGSDYLVFSLKFNDSISKFELLDFMEINESKDVEIALSWCNYINPIYMNSFLKKIFFFTENKYGMFKKNEFLVIKEYYNDWLIYNESKIINGFTCYKSEYTLKSINRKGKEVKRIVTAWFCPELPYSFGPNGYCGLPGLILELQDKNITYGVKKIEFKKNNIEIPESTKKIEFNEYENILKQRILKQKTKVEDKKQN
ncbi:GLPGLI family protein [uncultured Flavobacterium sp.]|uniref:GLPGLI family protein n=1 Tax=uncultured Flavobacterium sp. TaxID=165435 RepID=UPI0030EC76FA|tara:strand:+ start:565 stop:1299 length:735 start_codon:yes stop_codon:yes gene_type:complete